MTNIAKRDRRPEENPAAWFAVLESARQHGDAELAARAQRELKRLGVEVIYRARQRRQSRKGVGDGR